MTIIEFKCNTIEYTVFGFQRLSCILIGRIFHGIVLKGLLSLLLLLSFVVLEFLAYFPTTPGILSSLS